MKKLNTHLEMNPVQGKVLMMQIRAERKAYQCKKINKDQNKTHEKGKKIFSQLLFKETLLTNKSQSPQWDLVKTGRKIITPKLNNEPRSKSGRKHFAWNSILTNQSPFQKINNQQSPKLKRKNAKKNLQNFGIIQKSSVSGKKKINLVREISQQRKSSKKLFPHSPKNQLLCSTNFQF